MNKEFINYLDQKFNKIDERFKKNDGRFGRVDERFIKMEKRFDRVDERFIKMEKRFDRVDDQIKEKFNKVLDGQDRISKQLTDLQQESKMSLRLYQRHDKKIENHEERIYELELKAEPVL